MHHLCICIAVTAVTFCAVLGILSRHGYAVQLCTCVYIISLTLTQLLMAELSSKPFLYRYPAYVTVLHFLSCWIFSVAYWAAVGDLSKCHPRSLGHGRRFIVEVLPITITLPIAVACNNVALLYIAAGLNSVISALTPVTTALLSMAFGHTITRVAWCGLFIALAGAVLISLGEAKAGLQVNHTLLQGLLFALAAVVFRSLKSVLQDRILNSKHYASRGDRRCETHELLPKEPVSPMHLWALQAPPMVIVSLIYALCTENLHQALHHVSVHNLALILVTCISATVLNVLSAMTIQALGASLMQAIGKLNVIVTMVFSVAFLGETLPLKVVVGAAVMLVGIVVFEKAEDPSSQAADAASAAAAKAASLKV